MSPLSFNSLDAKTLQQVVQHEQRHPHATDDAFQQVERKVGRAVMAVVALAVLAVLAI